MHVLVSEDVLTSRPLRRPPLNTFKVVVKLVASAAPPRGYQPT